jgi:hypothetical protein
LQAGINKSIPISILNFNSLWNGTSLKIDWFQIYANVLSPAYTCWNSKLNHLKCIFHNGYTHTAVTFTKSALCPQGLFVFQIIFTMNNGYFCKPRYPVYFFSGDAI